MHPTALLYGQPTRVIIAVAAVLAAALTGCSTHGTTTSGASASTPASAAMTDDNDSSPRSGSTKVTIDGQARDIPSQVDCSSTLEGGSVMVIQIGDRNHGLVVNLTKADPPIVKAVASAGNIDHMTLAYPDQLGVPGGEATASKDGKTYTIIGTATGFKYNASADEAPVAMSFDIVVTCP